MNRELPSRVVELWSMAPSTFTGVYALVLTFKAMRLCRALRANRIILRLERTYGDCTSDDDQQSQKK